MDLFSKKKKLKNAIVNIIQFSFYIFFLYITSLHAAYNDTYGFKMAADFLNQGRYLEAISAYQEVVKYSPDKNNKARALLFLGNTYSLYLDQPQTALQIFNQIITHFPQTPSAEDSMFNSGTILYEQGNYKTAYSFFKTYIKSYPHGIRKLSAEVWADSAMEQIFKKKPEPTPPAQTFKIADTTIRVLLKTAASKVPILSNGRISVIDTLTKNEIFSGISPIYITKHNENLKINNKLVSTARCDVRTENGFILYQSQKYRGHFLIENNRTGIDVLNHVPLEQYLYGVIPKEMPSGWPEETLKAQAVAARTYALYIKKKSRDKPYDVQATTLSQVYGGVDGEKKETTHAVDSTRGQVMTYDNRLIISYFHSNSAGHTEDAKNVWSADIQYLRGKPDKFSQNIPNSHWEYAISYRKMQQLLNQNGFEVGKIKKIEALGRTASGRVLQIKLITHGKPTSISSNNFRIKIGGTLLKSTLFNIFPTTKGVIFKGQGYGHGVGMSQWGAYRMAQAGHHYPQILKHYYHGIKIKNISN